MTRHVLLNLVLALALAIMIGWLMLVGRSLIIPVVLAVISVYILRATAVALRRLPVIRACPPILLNLIILIGYTAIVLVLGYVVASAAQELVRRSPGYEAQLEIFVVNLSEALGVQTDRTVTDLRREFFEALNFQDIFLGLLGSVTNLGANLFLILVYAFFLMGEARGFAAKIAAAFPDRGDARQVMEVVSDINSQIGNYLSVKTLVNVVLGAISLVILLAFNVDFALFWALMIALFNYIPYVGSLIGVMFPTVLSIVQYGSISTTIFLGLSLTAAQMFVGNFVEPRWIGRQLNLSPFVVILSLSIWSSLWGLAGALLAIPLTSVLVIILRTFDETRFIPVLMAQRVAPPENESDHA